MPISDDGFGGYIQDFRHFFVAQTAEVFEFDDAAFAFVQSGESGQGFVEFDQSGGAFRGNYYRFVEFDLLPVSAAFLITAAVDVINQNMPHRLRRDSEKMGAVFPALLVLSG